MYTIIEYSDEQHRAQVVTLWKSALGYGAGHTQPDLNIDRKLLLSDGLFFVAVQNTRVVGTVLAGYDGHRGWLYSVAVQESVRGRGCGLALVRHAEQALVARGCVKINLQILPGNDAVSGFYAALGYAVEQRICMGKTIVANIPQAVDAS